MCGKMSSFILFPLDIGRRGCQPSWATAAEAVLNPFLLLFGGVRPDKSPARCRLTTSGSWRSGVLRSYKRFPGKSRHSFFQVRIVTASGQNASFAPVSVGSAGAVDELGKPREADLPTAVADATQSIGDSVLGIRGPRTLSPEVVSSVVQLLDVAAISLSGLGALAIYIVA